MAYRLARSDAEVNDLLNRAAERIDSGQTYAGLSFEEGIRDAVDWLVGTTDEDPIGEE